MYFISSISRCTFFEQLEQKIVDRCIKTFNNMTQPFEISAKYAASIIIIEHFDS
jgi:hypothetical protein